MGELAVRAIQEKRTLRQARVLVVDDDPSFRQMIETFLFLGGYTLVQEAQSGGEAWKLLSEDLAANNPNLPDLIITDRQMPGGSGPELVKRISEINPDELAKRGLARPCVIGVCGHPSDFKNDLNALDVPGSDGIPIIGKPFEVPDLMVAVQQALADHLGL